jgi:hypothetical protein
VRRMAHNPEVEGSNPFPATKARGPFLEQRKGLLCIGYSRLNTGGSMLQSLMAGEGAVEAVP